MKKFLLIGLTISLLSITGCGNNTKVLTCSQNGETTKITVKGGKIIKNATGDEEETITDEEWETLKKFYEFTGKETTQEVIDKLKNLNESIGYTCTVK